MKKQHRNIVGLIEVIFLLLVALFGCASSPDLRPTVETNRREFKRLHTLVVDGKIGYLNASETQSAELDGLLAETLSEHIKTCDKALTKPEEKK